MKGRLLHWVALGALVLGVCAMLSHNAYAGGPDAAVPAAASSPAAATPATPSSGSSSGTYSWTGFYAGGHVGYGWGNGDTFVNPLPTATTFVNLAPTRLHPDPSGIVGGGQLGYNYQRGHLIVGAEFNLSGTGMDGSITQTPIIQNNGTVFPGAGFLAAHQSTSWYGTVAPRLGVTLSQHLMVYGTGGLAFGHVNFSATSDFRPVGTEQYPAAFDKTKKGVALGAGAEFALSRRWVVKGEYLYYNLGDEHFTANPLPPFPPGAPNFQVKYDWKTTASTINFGVNFRF